MSKRRKSKGKAEEVTYHDVDATIIMGDLAVCSQITRCGNVVVLHERGDPRAYAMQDEAIAAYVWRTLAQQVMLAVKHDRQFFCISLNDFTEPTPASISSSTKH